MATKLADDPGLDADPTGGARPPGKTRSRAVILLLAVMAAEAAVLYFVLPRPVRPGTPASDTATDDNPMVDMVEVSIGQFQSTNSVAAPGSVIHVSFDLAATVVEGQSDAFGQTVKDSYKARVRQAVLQVTRSSSMDDLKDPEFRVLKRQIKEEVNKVLRKSYVNEVIVSDFRVIEQ